MNVLVAGATGMVGGAAAGMLASTGARVHGLVRATSDATKRQGLQASNVKLVEGDLTNAQSLEAACRGMDTVVSTVSAMPFSWAEGNTIDEVDREGQINLIEAAKRASVEHFVLVSFPHPPGVTFPLNSAKMAAEEHLKESGLDYTILLASFFMEIWLSPAFGFDHRERRATIFGDGSNRISWVGFQDVARTCTEAVSNGFARNAVLPVGGPEALSPLEVVGVFERAGGGESWNVVLVPVEALEQQSVAATDEVQQSVAGLQISYARGDYVMDPSGYLIVEDLKSIESYAEESVGS